MVSYKPGLNSFLTMSPLMLCLSNILIFDVHHTAHSAHWLLGRGWHIVIVSVIVIAKTTIVQRIAHVAAMCSPLHAVNS